MSMNAGDIEYIIEVHTQSLMNARRDVDDFNRRAERGFNSSSRSVEGLGSQMTKLAGAVAAVLAAAQLTAFIQDTALAVQEQKQFADSIKISYEQLQRLQFMASKAGVEFDALNEGLKEMTLKIREAAGGENEDLVKSFNEMGIALEKIENMSPDQQLSAIADGFAKIVDPAEKTFLATELFGEEATKLTNILEKGSDEIKKYTGELDKLGGVVGSKTADDFIAFNQHVDNIAISMRGIGVSAMAAYSDEMRTISEAISDFVKDGEKLQAVIDGIGVAAQATAIIIAGRLAGAFATWIAVQSIAIANTVALTGLFTTMSASASIAAIRIAAMSVATRGLGVAMAFLGGPVGIVVAAISALAAFALTSNDASKNVGALAVDVEDLTVKMTALSDLELDKSIKTASAQVKVLTAELKRAEEAMSKSMKGGSFIDQLNATQAMPKIKNLKEQIEKELQVKIEIRETREAEQQLKSSLRNISKTIESDKIKIEADKIFEFVGEANLDNLTDTDKILKDKEKELEELAKIYKKFPQLKQTQLEAELALEKKFQSELKKVSGNSESVERVKSQYAAELAETKKFYSENEKELEAARMAEAAIEKKYADLINEINQEKIDQRKEAKDGLVAISKAMTRELASESEKLALDEKAALDAVAEVLKDYPELESEAAAARIAIKQKFLEDARKLQELEAEESKKASQRVLDIIEETRKLLATEDENIIAAKEVSLAEIQKLRDDDLISLEEYESAKLAITKKAAAEQQKLDDDRAKKEADRIRKEAELRKKAAEEQKGKNDKFTGFASQFEETGSPMEELAKREASALEKLKELWEESNLSLETYEQAKTDLVARFGEERDSLRQEEIALQYQQAGLLASAGEDIMAAGADALKKAGKENSKAYKAMFAISKGFAVAQAGLNFAMAMSNAFASGPWPANLAYVAAAASSGAAFVGAITSATYSGRANGGPTSSGNMYKVNEMGPEVFSYGNNDYLMGQTGSSVTPLNKYMEGMNGSGGINVIINNNVANATVTASQGVTRDEVIVLIKETVPGEISDPNSNTAKSLEGSTSARRRLT